MSAYKCLASFLALVLMTSVGQAQTYTLQESSQKDSIYAIHLQTTLKGEMIIQQQDKQIPLKQSVVAHHQYTERVLQTGDMRVLGKTARQYKVAEVAIEVDKSTTKRTIRPQRRFVVVQRTKDGLVSFSPKGQFTREELEVTQHFDTLAIPGLLPNTKVSLGDTWKIDNPVAQAVCYFEGLTGHDLTGKLVNVAGNTATVSITGTAEGIDAGAPVKLKINAGFLFDLEKKRIVSLEWSQQDERGQGPVSPEIKAELVVKLTRTLKDPGEVPELSDIALIPVPTTPVPPAELTNLAFNDPKNRYELALDRDWIMVAQTKNHLVLRCLERGEFVAQATITVWPKTEPGKHLSGEEFEKVMAESPGWEPTEVTESKALPTEKGYFVYRVAASGELNGVETLQYFHLIAGPNGDQAVVAFALAPGQVQRLGTRDYDLVRSLVFPNSPKDSVVGE